nr:hypothetical protein [Tanacetum cinerariifolium]
MHAFDDAANERLKGERIGDQPDLTATAHARQRQLLRQGAADVVLGQQAEWQLIAHHFAARGDFDFAQQHGTYRGAETHGIGDVDVVDGRALAGKPAAFGQVGRQRVLLHGLAQRLFEQFFEALFENEGREVRQALGRFNVPAGHLILRGQQEPEEAVRRQRQQVIELANRWEGAATKHLDRNGPGVGRQFKLGRLRGCRDVGNTKDDFGLAVGAGVFAGVRQN